MISKGLKTMSLSLTRLVKIEVSALIQKSPSNQPDPRAERRAYAKPDPIDNINYKNSSKYNPI